MATYGHYGPQNSLSGYTVMPPARARPLVFRVITATSFSEAFPPDNLAVTAGSNGGWVSDEFCSFPQDLIIEFPSTAVIESVQLVVHRYFIPSVVDIFLMPDDVNPGMGISSSDLQPVAQFRYPDVEAETWNNDPLVKDIRFQPPLIAGLLQISCHRFLSNPYNLFDQVGIASVAFFGKLSDEPVPMMPNTMQQQSMVPYNMGLVRPVVQGVPQRFFRDIDYAPQYPRVRRQRPPFYFPFAQANFNPFRSAGRAEMMPMARLRSRDVSVSQLLVRLENYKQSAIRNEDFQTAASTKTVIDEVTKIEDQVHELELRKDEAIQDEDYQLAEQHKYVVYELTISALKYLRAHRFGHFFEKEQLKELEDALRKRRLRVLPAQTTANANSANKPTYESTSDAGMRAGRSHNLADRPIRPSGGCNDGFGGARVSKGCVTSETSEQQMKRQRAQPGPRSDSEKLKKGTQNHPGGFQYPLEVFGEEVVDLVCAPAFPSRVRGLERINAVLDTCVNEPPKNYTIGILIRATMILLETVLKEDAIIVQLTACLILKLLKDVIPAYPDSKSEVASVLAVALPFALSRLGNTNRRISQILMPFVVEMATINVVRSLPTVPQVCCDPVKPTAQVRYSVGRVRIVQDLLTALPIGEASGLTIELLVQFSISAMEHHDPEVRRGGEKIIIWLYDWEPPASFRPNASVKEHKSAYHELIRNILPTPPQVDNEKGPRDFKYRRLFTVLGEIDAGNRTNVPLYESRLRSPALAPEHFPFYSTSGKANLSQSGASASEAGAVNSPVPTAANDVDLAETRSHIRVVISRNRSPPSGLVKDTKSSDTFSKEKPPISPSGSIMPDKPTTPLADDHSRSHSPASGSDEKKTPDRDTPKTPDKPKTPLVKEIIPLQRHGKKWKYLTVLAETLLDEGYEVIEKDTLNKDKTKWPHHLVTTCPFCGKPDSAVDLNHHLYQECPMLKKCEYCHNKVLVPDMAKHHLEKCMKKKDLEVCPKCRLAVLKKQLAKHVKANHCADPSLETNAAACPLCGELVENSDDGWVHHLLDKTLGCHKNPRRTKALKWTSHLAAKASTSSLVKITGATTTAKS